MPKKRSQAEPPEPSRSPQANGADQPKPRLHEEPATQIHNLKPEQLAMLAGLLMLVSMPSADQPILRSKFMYIEALIDIFGGWATDDLSSKRQKLVWDWWMEPADKARLYRAIAPYAIFRRERFEHAAHQLENRETYK